MSITITLEEPYELLIYCSRYGCDWRLRDPKTKRFMYAPGEIYFICHKRGSLETKKGQRRVTIESEMQGVCTVTREWIRENQSIEEIETALRDLEQRCISCSIVSDCLGDVLLSWLAEEVVIDSVSHSFSLTPDSCYIHIEERHGTRWYERDYQGEVVECFG